jgi:hypothetical protein
MNNTNYRNNRITISIIKNCIIIQQKTICKLKSNKNEKNNLFSHNTRIRIGFL